MLKLRGLTEEEYEVIKAAIKEELPFRVNVRRWKRQYALGAIDIRPTAKDKHRFTKDQLDEVYALMQRHGLRVGGTNYFETVPHYDIIFNVGVCFVYKKCN